MRNVQLTAISYWICALDISYEYSADPRWVNYYELYSNLRAENRGRHIE
jgi:hypothetical protein